MNDELDRKIQLIEEKISKINDRESRKIQFKLSTYSMVLGAIIALSVALIVECIKLLIPNQLSTFIGLTIYVCLIVAIIIFTKSKELMDIGDFEFTGNLDIQKKRAVFFEKIESIVSNKNNSLTKNISHVFKGFTVFGYWYHTSFNCDYNDKIPFSTSL